MNQSTFNDFGTSAGIWAKTDEQNSYYTTIVELSQITTTSRLSPNRQLAENNALTGTGITLYSISISVDTIRELRRVSGLTWEQLANLFDVSRRALHLWDSGCGMSAANQEKLGRILNAVRSLGQNNANEVRQLLLTGFGGQIPLDLLKDSRFSEFQTIKDFLIPNKPKVSVSAQESRAREPLAPDILVSAKHDTIHVEKRKIRSFKTRRFKKA